MIENFDEQRNQRCATFTEQEIREFYESAIITATFYLHFIKKSTQPEQSCLSLPNAEDFYKEWGIPKRSFYRAAKDARLKRYFDVVIGDGLVTQKIEHQVRDRLHSHLGGLREVQTPAGRIDLLTDTEIIEVKNIKDWKAAMGQVLAYSGFYPEHRKRLHLFGKKGEMVSSTAVTICAELGIAVTFEEVE